MVCVGVCLDGVALFAKSSALCTVFSPFVWRHLRGGSKQGDI